MHNSSSQFIFNVQQLDALLANAFKHIRIELCAEEKCVLDYKLNLNGCTDKLRIL